MTKETPSILDPRCQLCDGLAGIPFCRISADENTSRRQPRIHRKYPARQVIFHEGDPPAYVYYIQSGTVKLYKQGSGERPVVLRLLGPGDLFGYRAVLGSEDFAATAEAFQDSVICAIPAEIVHHELPRNPDLALYFIRRLCLELRESEEMWLHDSQEAAPKRVLRVLARLANAAGEVHTGGSKKQGRVQRLEIAELVGISSETFSRILRKLEQRGMLELSGSIIKINKILLRLE